MCIFVVQITNGCIGISTIAGDHIVEASAMVLRATNFLNVLQCANAYTVVLAGRRFLIQILTSCQIHLNINLIQNIDSV